MIKKSIHTLTLSLIVFGLVSCAGSTRLIESWHDETYTGEPKLEKVLILGVFTDDVQRRAFESKFAESVVSEGKQAIAGYTLMPEEEDYDDKEDIINVVSKINADSVLITSLKSVAEEERYIPPSANYMPTMGFGYYGSYYGAAYQTIYTPGYTVVDSVVYLETRLYSVASEKLIWAGKTKSVNSASGEKITLELVDIVTKDLRATGIIE